MLKQARSKWSRREGRNLFVKGARSFSEKEAFARRASRPGQHGAKPVRLSPYGRQLREKQKVKRMYGMREKQFRRFYEVAQRLAKNSGQDRGYLLLRMLESRLDNIVYRSGLAKSRPMARQMVGHKLITVNGKTVNIASYLTKEGDVVALKKPDQFEKFKADYAMVVPEWIDVAKHQAKVKALPTREQMDQDIKESLIIELYSR